MTMIEIHTDSREKASGIIGMLQKRENVTIVDSHLPVGDYSVGGGIVIERKSANDFLNSMRDDRFHEQALNMVLHAPRPVYLLEGDIYATRSEFSVESLSGAVAWLHAQGISIVPSSSPRASAETIFFMAKNAQVDMRNVPLRSKKPKVTELNVKLVLESFPGIGAGGSEKLISHFGSIRSLVMATPEQIAEVPRIGKASAQKIHDVIIWTRQ
jgi:ERCC4-type nuclease